MNWKSDREVQGSSWQGEESGERVDRELKRLWDSEIRDHFRAEGDFLRNYGAQAGYEDGYIQRVLEDHQKLEELVHRGGEGNAVLFSRVLSCHFRYKDEYLVRHLDRMTRKGGEVMEPTNDPRLN